MNVRGRDPMSFVEEASKVVAQKSHAASWVFYSVERPVRKPGQGESEITNPCAFINVSWLYPDFLWHSNLSANHVYLICRDTYGYCRRRLASIHVWL